MTPDSSFSVAKPHIPFCIGPRLEDAYEICDADNAAGVFDRFEVSYGRPEIPHLGDYRETLTLSETIRMVVSILESLEALYPEKGMLIDPPRRTTGRVVTTWLSLSMIGRRLLHSPTPKSIPRYAAFGDTKIVRLCIP